MTSTGNGEVTRRHGRGWIITALGVLLIVLALAALGTVVLLRSQAGAQGPPAAPPPAPEPPPEAVLAVTAAAETPLTAAEVQAVADPLVSAPELGDRVFASVVDLTSGRQLYAREPQTLAIPASTVKLATAAAVLAVPGPDHRIPTTAVAGAEPGEVVLVGGGDPTLAVDEEAFYPGAARLDLLASQVLAALGDTGVTSVSVDTSAFTGPVHGPWTSDIPTGGYVGPITALMTDGARVDPDPAQGMQAVPRRDEPDLAAGEAFAELLGLGDDATVRRTEAPEDAQVLGEVLSPPIRTLVEIMLTTSENTVAEGLARQVALARGEPASYQGAATAMAEVLAGELGLPLPAGGGFADGSGLSRDNQIHAGLLTDVLLLAAGPEEDRLGAIFSGLPVAGWSGTLADRYEDGDEGGVARGLVRAKTGTLNTVDTLAGVVVTESGHALGFALLADEVTGSHEDARAALDRFAAELAGL